MVDSLAKKTERQERRIEALMKNRKSQSIEFIKRKNYSKEMLIDRLAENMVLLSVYCSLLEKAERKNVSALDALNKTNERLGELEKNQDEAFQHIKNAFELRHGLPFPVLAISRDKAIAIEAVRKVSEQIYKTSFAKSNAQKSLNNNPKQADKKAVKRWWDEWQVDPDTYKSDSAFARDMLVKFEALKSPAVIARWCREWRKEAGK